MSADLEWYREHLVQAEQKSIEAYDKSLLALSGGALGVSFAFIKDITQLMMPGPFQSTYLLILAWSVWVLTIGLTLFSFYSSHRALRKSIKQVDKGTIYKETAGGRWARATHCLNAAAGVLFVCGLALMIVFAARNVGE